MLWFCSVAGTFSYKLDHYLATVSICLNTKQQSDNLNTGRNGLISLVFQIPNLRNISRQVKSHSKSHLVAAKERSVLWHNPPLQVESWMWQPGNSICWGGLWYNQDTWSRLNPPGHVWEILDCTLYFHHQHQMRESVLEESCSSPRDLENLSRGVLKITLFFFFFFNLSTTSRLWLFP